MNPPYAQMRPKVPVKSLRQGEPGGLRPALVYRRLPADGRLADRAGDDDAATLLAKAAAAFRANHERAQYWNWNVHETRKLLNMAGDLGYAARQPYLIPRNGHRLQ